MGPRAHPNVLKVLPKLALAPSPQCQLQGQAPTAQQATGNFQPGFGLLSWSVAGVGLTWNPSQLSCTWPNMYCHNQKPSPFKTREPRAQTIACPLWLLESSCGLSKVSQAPTCPVATELAQPTAALKLKTSEAQWHRWHANSGDPRCNRKLPLKRAAYTSPGLPGHGSHGSKPFGAYRRPK